MIEIRQLNIRVGEFRLTDINLTIADREYFVVLGPTGAGKTVLLECIAGILMPDSGTILADGRDVTRLPPEYRQVGYLPQDHALFPHLTVRENLAFGLTIRKRAGEIPEKIPRLSEMLGIAHLLDRRPAKLSGGEKQRVALGRALAIDPDVMLLDEPLSALDTANRERIGDEIRGIHDKAGLTSVHICHNFDETLRLADRVALMRDGRIVQVGTSEEILRRPGSLFAAEFVRSENILGGSGGRESGLPGVRIGRTFLQAGRDVTGEVHVTVRPDEVRVLTADGAEAPPTNLFAGSVEAIEDRGVGYAIRTRGDLPLTALVPRLQWQDAPLRIGDRVRLQVAPESVHTFPKGNE